MKKTHFCNFRPVRCRSLCQKQRSGAPNIGFGPIPYLRHLSGGLLDSFHMAESEHPPRKSEGIWILRFDYGRFRGPRNRPETESPPK